MASPVGNLRLPSPRGERTRSAILEAAEQLFATRGFEGTRVEDVAEAVGIRRASIVYYFRDKRALYTAVLADLLSALHDPIEAALSGKGDAHARVEAAVCAWVDFLVARPTFGRLLLREIASAPDGSAAPALSEHLEPFLQLVRRFIEDSRVGEARFPDALDAAHVASAIAGASVFYATALPRLLAGDERGSLAPADSAPHRAALLSVTRRLLGSDATSGRASGALARSDPASGTAEERS